MKIRRKGLFIVLSSPSGGGKTTLKDKIIKVVDGLKGSISYTTRQLRGDEKEGKDYYFIDKDNFENKIKKNEFIEYAQVHSNYYGTGKEILEQINNGIDVIMAIDVQGGKSIKDKHPEAVLVFIVPPCWSELESRLKNRKTDSENVIEERLENAKQEISIGHDYDYLLINDKIDHCLFMLESIIKAERQKINRMEVDWDDFYSS